MSRSRREDAYPVMGIETSAGAPHFLSGFRREDAYPVMGIEQAPKNRVAAKLLAATLFLLQRFISNQGTNDATA